VTATSEAYDLTRDTFVQLLYAHAKADGVTISTGQIYQMLDTALERAGLRLLIEVFAAADGAAVAYAGTYEEPPEGVGDADTSWRGGRAQLADYPNLSVLIP
jgi:hypothetical protein